MSADPELVAGCKNGSCPKVYRSGTRAAVQGTVDTLATRQIMAQGRETVVEIPVAVLEEALDELGKWSHGDAVPASATSPEGGPLVRRVGDVVIVRGEMGTELTERIKPGTGELVVEVPLWALVLHDELVVV